jgi:hypothetical protein
MFKYIVGLFVLLSLSACQQKQPKNDTITMGDGTEISLQPHVDLYSKILGKSVDTKEFCKCYLPKYYSFLKLHPDKLKLFNQGKPVELSEADYSNLEAPYLNCIIQTATNDTSIKVTFTNDVIGEIKMALKNELSGSKTEKNNDIDKYCDCLIKGIQKKFTAREFYGGDYIRSKKYNMLEAKCSDLTKKE